MTDPRHVYVLGGTAFSRQVVDGLEAGGYAVRLSVATDLGAAEVELPPTGGIHNGRMDSAALVGELRAWQAEALVDATHPYAVLVSGTAREAAVAAGVPLFRATRAPWRPAAGHAALVRFFTTEAEATAALRESGRTALFTVGAKGVQAFAGSGMSLAVRVLPTVESVGAALSAGVSPERLIAAYPPYTAEFTAACMRHLGCTVIVSKESGSEGGLDEKVAAAELVGGELFVLSRPEEPTPAYHDVQSLLEGMEERWKRS